MSAPCSARGSGNHPFTTDWGSLHVANLSTKIHRAVGAKKPPNEERLMGWYEDALDLENACRNWEKAAELRQSKIRRSLANRFTPVA
jgi:hypothetical protein